MKSSASSYRASKNRKKPACTSHHAASDGLALGLSTKCLVANAIRSPHSNSPLIEVVASALAAAASAAAGLPPHVSKASTRFAACAVHLCHGLIQNKAEQSTPQTLSSTSEDKFACARSIFSSNSSSQYCMASRAKKPRNAAFRSAAKQR